MKQVKIICGASGSGKSTLTKELIESCEGSVIICSADSFFINPVTNEYNFDLAKLGDAHKSCLQAFVTHIIQLETDLVIVDNTNTTIMEVAPYAALAMAYGYDLEIIIFAFPSGQSAIDEEAMLKKLSSRNVHGVEERVIRAQNARLKNLTKQFPPWWKRRMVDVEA